MTDFKREWTFESAMKVLEHPTVDSKLWAEAVEWLLLYGPPEVREMLKQASSYATTSEFPDLKPQSYTPAGEPVYSIGEIAGELGISEEKAAELIRRKEEKHGVGYRLADEDTWKVQ